MCASRGQAFEHTCPMVRTIWTTELEFGNGWTLRFRLRSNQAPMIPWFVNFLSCRFWTTGWSLQFCFEPRGMCLDSIADETKGQLYSHFLEQLVKLVRAWCLHKAGYVSWTDFTSQNARPFWLKPGYSKFELLTPVIFLWLFVAMSATIQASSIGSCWMKLQRWLRSLWTLLRWKNGRKRFWSRGWRPRWLLEWPCQPRYSENCFRVKFVLLKYSSLAT